LARRGPPTSLSTAWHQKLEEKAAASYVTLVVWRLTEAAAHEPANDSG
jgi:hypothetical protein